MNLVHLLNSPACTRLAIVLGHFVWQGFVVAVLAVIVARLLGRNASNIRYGVFMTALIGMAFCVPITYFAVGPIASPADLAADTTADSASAPLPMDGTSVTLDPVVESSLDSGPESSGQLVRSAEHTIDGHPNARQSRHRE